MAREHPLKSPPTPTPAGVLLSNERHWGSNDEFVTPEERASPVDTAPDPEQALIAKEEAERDAGLRRFRF
jgi:hypothetical protein